MSESLDFIARAWRSAPLPLRLGFVSDILPADHAAQPVLKEAMALERQRLGEGLETWLIAFPSLFADAVGRIEITPAFGEEPADVLAEETLREARDTFSSALRDSGLEWIAPAAGNRIGEDQEVVGEEAADAEPGTVARLIRRGFRWRGRLYLPAQVMRANKLVRGASPEARPYPVAAQVTPLRVAQCPAPAPDPQPSAMRSASAALPAELRALGERAAGAPPAVEQMARIVAAAASGLERSAVPPLDRLAPLLPLLGPRAITGLSDLLSPWGALVAEAREALAPWLSAQYAIEVIAPLVGDPFVPETMRAVGSRPTVHVHEDGTVARVEQVGLSAPTGVLIPAQVIRYQIGAET